MMLAVTQNPANLIIPILLFLAIIAVCVTIFSIMTWNVEPWTRKYLKPHKQLRMDRYRVKIWRLRSRYPEAFNAPSPFREQDLDIAKTIVEDVEHHVEDSGSNPSQG